MTSSVRAFYDDLAEEYEAIFGDWDLSVRWQASIIEPLLGDAPDPVLDIAAGMGTQAIGLALRGHSVVARDLSHRLVERGRREAARLGAQLEFEISDMRDARPSDAGRYGAVIAIDNALPHLETDSDLRLALRAVRLALKPRGRFVASVRDYDTLVSSRPIVDPPRVLGAAPQRRVVLQVWNWAADGKSYEFDHIILREEGGAWSSRSCRGRYRALLRAELDAAAVAEGLSDLQWLMLEASGFYQPIFIATRPD